MPVPRLRAPRQRPLVDLTPEDELRARLGPPSALQRELQAIDADIEARGLQLHGLYVRAALRAARNGIEDRALSMVRGAQLCRRDLP